MNFVSDLIVKLMSTEFLGTTISEFLKMNLAEAFSHLCENMSVGTFLIVLFSFGLLKGCSRAIERIVGKRYKHLPTRLPKIFDPSYRPKPFPIAIDKEHGWAGHLPVQDISTAEHLLKKRRSIHQQRVKNL